MCFGEKHVNTKITCHVTCVITCTNMWHVFLVFMCFGEKHVNTKITCHVGKVFMCFSMEHMNTKKTCYMSEWCFCVFAKHVFLSHGICVYGKHVLTNERHKRMAPNTSSRWSRFWLVDATCTNTKMTNIINEWKIASFIPEISTETEVLPPLSTDYENRIFWGAMFFLIFFSKSCYNVYGMSV